MSLEEVGFKTALEVLEEQGRVGIQLRKKKLSPLESPLLNEARHASFKNFSQGKETPSEEKLLSLNSNGEDGKQGKEKSTVIENVNFLSLNSSESEIQNKGKKIDTEELDLEDVSALDLFNILAIYDRMSITNKGKKLQLEKLSQVVKRKRMRIELPNKATRNWGLGSWRIKAVKCTPKPCRGCPHKYLTFRWYDSAGKQREKIIAKVI